MSLQTMEINSTQIVFDKQKTKEYRTNYNNPCDCQDCRNYYKNIENNTELLDFLEKFGIDFNRAEEVFSWDLDNNINSLIHHEAYYGVFGNIEGEEFEFEKFGIEISFAKAVSVPHDREGEYFWICIKGDFSYVLEEEREIFENVNILSGFLSEKKRKSAFIKRLKSIIVKK